MSGFLSTWVEIWWAYFWMGWAYFQERARVLKNIPTPSLSSHLSSLPMGVFSRAYGICRHSSLLCCQTCYQAQDCAQMWLHRSVLSPQKRHWASSVHLLAASSCASSQPSVFQGDNNSVRRKLAPKLLARRCFILINVLTARQHPLLLAHVPCTSVYLTDWTIYLCILRIYVIMTSWFSGSQVKAKWGFALANSGLWSCVHPYNFMSVPMM